VKAAEKAFSELNSLTLETRKQLIANMRKTALEHRETISKMASEETGFGRWEDKVIKNELAINKTPGVEDLESIAYSDDMALQ
jgi:propionaldehyde dehydrogenase